MASTGEARSALVDVVVPTYDAREVVLECVNSLDDEVIAERIVVDDVSSDGTAEAVREQFPEAIVVELDEHRGLSHALNAGARHGSAPYVLFINNDLVAEPGSIRLLVEALASHPGAASAGGRLVDPGSLRTQEGYRPRDFPTLATIIARLAGIERFWRKSPWSGAHVRRPLGDGEVVRVDQQ